MSGYKYDHEDQLKSRIMEYADKECPYPGEEKAWNKAMYSVMDEMSERQLAELLLSWNKSTNEAQ
jgi:hypothetical protein